MKGLAIDPGNSVSENLKLNNIQLIRLSFIAAKVLLLNSGSLLKSFLSSTLERLLNETVRYNISYFIFYDFVLASTFKPKFLKASLICDWILLS